MPTWPRAVLFDFDGTLAEDTWPSPHVGKPIREALEALRHYYTEGYSIVVYTARPASHTNLIVGFLREMGVDLLVYDIVTGKPRADLYIDDRAWRPSWVEEPVLRGATPDLDEGLEDYEVLG